MSNIQYRVFRIDELNNVIGKTSFLSPSNILLTMTKIKHRIFPLKDGKIDTPKENAKSFDHLSDAVASAKEPGEYVILPVVIVKSKSKKDGEEITADSDNEQG